MEAVKNTDKALNINDNDFKKTSIGEGQFTGYITYNPYQVHVGKSVLYNEDNTESFTVLSTERILRGCFYDNGKKQWVNFSEILLGGMNTISAAAFAITAGVLALSF